MRDPRLLTSLVFVASAVLMAAVRAWQIAGRGAVWWNDSAPLLVVGAATVALALPHALVSWHSDGMETARHLMVPTLQLYLGALVMVLGVLGAQSRTQVASGE